ncbi:unnamed protein product [Symbiodinium microadriaticum]|nr:unnamed protein product [Symbiodinium microadriaticum]
MSGLSSLWASSTTSRRHGTILVRELSAGADVDKLGFCVPSLPPQPVVVKRVEPRSWAASQELRAGDVLIQLNDVPTGEMSSQHFLESMTTRPLNFKFVVNPLRSSRSQMRGGEEDSESDDAAKSDAVEDEGDNEEESPTPRSAEKCRRSVSDWYAEEEIIPDDNRKKSLTSWYLDGARMPDTTSQLTAVHRMSLSGAEQPLEIGEAAELRHVLQAALSEENLDALLLVIARAQSQGIIADVLEVAQCKAQATTLSIPSTSPVGQQRSLRTVSRPELFRGVPLHVALSNWGRHWRAPDQGMFNVDPKNYQLSRPTKAYDAFLSHEWASSRWLKFLSLLMIFNSKPAFAISFLVSVLVGTLRACRVIPDQTWTVSIVHAVYFTIFLFWQRIRAIFCRPLVVFLDKLCVAQHDEELKQEGIQSLGAFLLSSRELVVLLSPQYLSRLWCVFEISTFLRDRASLNRLRIIPQNTTLLLLMVAGCWHLLASYYFSLIRYGVLSSWGGAATSGLTFTAAMLGFCSLLVPLSFYVGIGLMSELQEVPRQLASFRIQDSKCYCCSHSHVHPRTGEPLPCDRQLVYEAIQDWWVAETEDGSDPHLERFNASVRQRVAPKIANGMGIGLPFQHVVCTAVFCIVPWLADFIALWAETIDRRPVISIWSLRHFVTWGIVGLALLFSLRVAIWLWILGSWIEKRLSSRWLAVFIVTPLSFLAVCSLWLPLGISLAATHEDNPLPVIIFGSGAALTAFLWHVKREPQPSLQPSQISTSRRRDDDDTFSI